jgi:pimeloyl-ACP methyl ester carboxylesterase
VQRLDSGSPRRKIASRALNLLLPISVACLLAASDPTAFASGNLATTRPTADDIQLIKAGGVVQSLDCQGTGQVTLVVVTGLASPASAWSLVAPGFREVTRTCFYDRPGIGASPARSNKQQVLNAGLFAAELAALLHAAGEPGPYVILGHSFGGLIARAFTKSNLSSVRGLLLAESVDPSDRTTGKYWHEAGHSINMPLSQSATGGGPRIGQRPLLVLSASNPEGDHLGGPTYGQNPAAIGQWIKQQRADVHLSMNSIQVIATSGHVLQQDDPAAVIAAVRSLVQAVNDGGGFDCASDWIAVAAICH